MDDLTSETRAKLLAKPHDEAKKEIADLIRRNLASDDPDMLTLIVNTYAILILDSMKLRDALREAIDFVTPNRGADDHRFNAAGGHESETLPMYTRIGNVKVSDRIVEWRKLAP